jgi:branched-chain amino acid transport system ATP-binding protein
LLLEVKELRVSYGRIQALKNVSLEVETGEVVALIGSNGAGKTTLLKSLVGLLPGQGAVRYQGKDILGRSPAHLVRSGLMLVPEGRQILAGMSVHENLLMGAFTRRDHAQVKKDLESVLERFPALKGRMSQPGGTLSGGEQQMLAIARALLARPRLLLMDEPSLGLAPILVQQIFSIIRDLKAQHQTVLLVEQNARQALQVADRAYVLETGRITLEGPGKELLENPRVQQAYLGKSVVH